MPKDLSRSIHALITFNKEDEAVHLVKTSNRPNIFMQVLLNILAYTVLLPVTLFMRYVQKIDISQAIRDFCTPEVTFSIYNLAEETPLFRAAVSGMTELVDALIEAGESANTSVVPLDSERGARYQEEDIIREHGWRIEATPLHAAALYAHASIVEALLAAGGIQSKNHQLELPLHLSINNINPESGIPELLIDNFMKQEPQTPLNDGSMRNQAGLTPIDLARSARLYNVARIMESATKPESHYASKTHPGFMPMKELDGRIQPETGANADTFKDDSLVLRTAPGKLST